MSTVRTHYPTDQARRRREHVRWGTAMCRKGLRDYGTAALPGVRAWVDQIRDFR